jgi:spermidine/putrescine transport system permease protein
MSATVFEPEALEPAAVPLKPGRPRKRRRGGRALRIYTGIVIAYLFLPIGVMIAFGFNNPRGRFNFTWEGFTLRWYRELFALPDLTTALKNSLVIASVTTIVATTLGTAIALALTRYKFRGRSATNLGIFLPLATPEIVLGASLLSLFVTANISRGILTIMIAHVMFNISYVVVTVKARTHGFNNEWEDAAKDLGATPWVAFRTVTLPLILPGVLAGAILAFALSVDDFVITAFNAGQTQTFPLWVYGASRIGVPPQVNVMGTMLFLVGVLAALASGFIERRRVMG